MANLEHSTLTGTDLHEPKGASSANSGDVYIANGAGSGTWTPTDNQMTFVSVTVAFGDLASAATKTLIDSSGTETYKVREIFLSGALTNFDAGGDRLVDITDGTTTWSIMPVASLKSLVVSRWGDTALPLPATAAHFDTASVAGTDIHAVYSGGATDYTAGSMVLVIGYERIA